MEITKYYKLYKLHVPKLKQNNKSKYRGNCPFHKEKTLQNKAFSVDIETGQYYCHSCGVKGNAITFARHFGEDEKQYYDFGFNNNSIPASVSNVIYKDSKNWLKNMNPIWDVNLLESLKVGWCEGNNNYVFNIFDDNRKIINVKHHKGKQYSGAKASLYPNHFIRDYKRSYIIITEGEKDVISLLTFGFQSITSTGGALTVPIDISILKEFDKIYLCFDNDEAGDDGIDKWIKKLKHQNPKQHIRICDLSKYIENGGDVTDYLSSNNKNRKSFIYEILFKSKYAKSTAVDQHDLFRKTALLKDFQNLSVNDQNVFFNLFIRATRYRVDHVNYNRIPVRLNPGEYVKSDDKLAKLCGRGMTARKVGTSLEHLQKHKFISIQKLKQQKGKIFKIHGWNNENVQGPCGMNNTKNVEEEFPIFTITGKNNSIEKCEIKKAENEEG